MSCGDLEANYAGKRVNCGWIVYTDHSSCSGLNVDFSMFVSLFNCVSNVFLCGILCIGTVQS